MAGTFSLKAILAMAPPVYGPMPGLSLIHILDAVGDTTTVTVHVNRLREKIETDNREPRYIETVWGAGYRFKI